MLCLICSLDPRYHDDVEVCLVDSHFLFPLPMVGGKLSSILFTV